MRTTFITFILLATALINTSAQDQTTAADYERQIVASYTNKNMPVLDSLLKSYYNTGLYPIDVLMYNYNELQGMEDWSVIVMSSAESLIGKLILQRVLNEHRDKVLVCIETGGLDATICGKLGIAEPLTSGRPEEVFEKTIKWVAEHSDRKVYFPFTDSPLFKQFPDAMKACIYNEGLTMRYSAKPYNNLAVKRRNVEQRYLMDNLVMQFHPEVKSTTSAKHASSLASNYLLLLHDLMPYYKKHNAVEYARLNRIFAGIMRNLGSYAISFPNSDKYYSVEYKTDGSPHYEFVEKVSYKIDPNVDDATNKKRFEEHEKNEKNRRVLIKTDPIEE